MLSQKNTFRRLTRTMIEAVSFNSKIRDLADMLNRKAEQLEEATPDLLSHPGGFTRAFHKRRMGIAESYIRIARQLDKNNHLERLHALKTLIKLSLHAKTVRMPLNTARVQIEIMKEAVKNIHNKRRQMEMIRDFSQASYGHEAVIRHFLKELKRVEVPEEEGKPLKSLDLGWDSHVHDNLTEGRKTPSQLILDAFIKGISRVTLAYYDLPYREIIFEAAEAGKILGIRVNIGIEFSVGPRHRRKHFMFTPPISDYAAFLEFFNQNCRALSPFVDGLEENRSRRRGVITEILENFNHTHRITLNQGYEEESLLSLPPLRFEDLEKLVSNDQYSRSHLGELLYGKLKDILKKRVFALRTQYEISRRLLRQKTMTSWEVERINAAYQKTRETYARLTPAGLKSEYFSGKNIVDYDSAFPSESHILPELCSLGGHIAYNHPLVHGLSEVISTIIHNHAHIDRIELMNMRDSMTRDPSEIIRLSRFVDLINNGELSDVKAFIRDWHSGGIDDDKLCRAFEKYHHTPLLPLAGSSSTGWIPRIPGMGFIQASRIPKKSRKHFILSHYMLPRPVSELIVTKGRRCFQKNNEKFEIYSLGQSGRFKPNLVGDEDMEERISPKRLWRYLNPTLKNFVRIIVGLIPAWLWIGPGYTAIWFGITFFRNVFVDLVAFSSFRPSLWSPLEKNVNFENAAQSLFWTGFSVPILGMVKQGFDMGWPFGPEGLVFEWSRFFFICMANGLYISAHNRLRQFDRQVIRANFFRSILAWPFSAVFAPVGNILMVPSIVQAKFWSDVVAAVIEGTAKFRQKIVLRRRDLLELLPLLRSQKSETRYTAMLDILYIWALRQRGRTSLAGILRDKGSFFSGKKRAKQEKTEKKKESEQNIGAEWVNEMLALYSPHRSHIELSRFVIERFTDRETLVLTDLINDSLVPFYIWLKQFKNDQAQG